MNTAIIVAAGSGTRFGSEIPKQFLEIHGKPIIVHTIERFEACEAIDEIVLVLAVSEIERFSRDFPKIKTIVAGGRTRADSVLNGLRAANGHTEIVAVHDGARPLVSVREIERVVSAAEEYGAACLVAPVTDTIKEFSGGIVTGTLDRRMLRRALTPQAFRIDILREAFTGVELHDAFTDECSLVERLGHEIAAVEGSLRNIKITHPDDLKIAEVFLAKNKF
ncbi:MAG TPA: 2-C-methyl-D-erythritol 4-phosphate cytidylyltransferase [Pyrinomonadaceae bacterium]|jgi:2-C-methyl-D-erythritol 4-phosphate cytidylyltransferase|nr:2-C-methyl-D-erythritol 4-phosphate cytidylyltransferase [Pyrinomonadaceae bacterium]